MMYLVRFGWWTSDFSSCLRFVELCQLCKCKLLFGCFFSSFHPLAWQSRSFGTYKTCMFVYELNH